LVRFKTALPSCPLTLFYFRTISANFYCAQVASMAKMHFMSALFCSLFVAHECGEAFCCAPCLIGFFVHFQVVYEGESGRRIVFNMLQIKLKQVCGWPKKMEKSCYV